MWLFYAISAAIFWGLGYSLDEKILQNNISTFILLAAQSALAVLIYFIVIATTRIKNDISPVAKNNETALLLIAAAVCTVIANIFICFSIKEKNATLSGIIELAYPIFTVIFSYFLFKQYHVNWGVIMGGILIFAGVLLISLVN